MVGGQRSETEPRRSTVTHILEEISWQEVRNQRQSCREAQELTCWKRFHGMELNIRDRAEEKDRTHKLEEIL